MALSNVSLLLFFLCSDKPRRKKTKPVCRSFLYSSSSFNRCVPRTGIALSSTSLPAASHIVCQYCRPEDSSGRTNHCWDCLYSYHEQQFISCWCSLTPQLSLCGDRRATLFPLTEKEDPQRTLLPLIITMRPRGESLCFVCCLSRRERDIRLFLYFFSFCGLLRIVGDISPQGFISSTPPQLPRSTSLSSDIEVTAQFSDCLPVCLPTLPPFTVSRGPHPSSDYFNGGAREERPKSTHN